MPELLNFFLTILASLVVADFKYRCRCRKNTLKLKKLFLDWPINGPFSLDVTKKRIKEIEETLQQITENLGYLLILPPKLKEAIDASLDYILKSQQDSSNMSKAPYIYIVRLNLLYAWVSLEKDEQLKIFQNLEKLFHTNPFKSIYFRLIFYNSKFNNEDAFFFL